MRAALAQTMGMDRFEERLVAVFDAGLSGWSGVAALAVACGLGAAHAIGPGHGKAVLGAYLAATRGRVRDAVGVGMLVAAMHTLSALLVGAALFAFASTDGATGRLTSWLMLAAGAMVTILGATMLRSHHRHHHHDHLPPGVSPLSRRGVVVLGVSGGLIPSPASFLVLATGLVAGRAGTALLLVGAFAIGMAVTLTAVGAAVVGGRVFVERRGETSTRFARILGVLPTLGAAGVTLGGVVLVVAAASRLFT